MEKDLSGLTDEQLMQLASGKMPIDETNEPDLSQVSDEELVKLAKGEPPKESFGKRMLRAGVESLPMAGAVFGGGIGSMAPGVGTAAGAIGGGAVGASLRSLGKKYLLDEPVSRSELYAGPVYEGVIAGTGEMAGQVLGKGLQAGSRGLKEFLSTGLNKNADDIVKATQAIGAKATPAQITKDVYVQNLQSSLEQSPSVAGYLTRKETDPVLSGLKNKSSDIFKDVPSLQPSDVGAEFKQGLRGLVENRLQPISKVYDDVKASTQFISVDPKSLKRVSKNISALEPFSSSPGKAVAEGISADLLNVKTVDDIKRIRGFVGKELNNPNISPVAKSTYSQIYGKLSDLEQNTIIREAIKQGRNSNEGMVVASELVGDLLSANKGYRDILQDLGALGKGSGVDKNVKSIQNFLARVDNIPDEKVVDTFFKTGNRKSLIDLKRIDPSGFESLKNAKLDMIRKASEVQGEIVPARLLKNVEKLEPATRDLMFGPQSAEMLNTLKTVVDSLPAKIGPSGTPKGIEWLNFFNPATWPGEVARLAQRGLIKYKVSGQSVPLYLQRPGGTVQNLIPQSLLRGVSESAIDRRLKLVQPRAADSEQ